MRAACIPAHLYIPAGRPTTELNTDAVYLDPNPPPISEADQKSRLSPVLLSDHLAINQKFPQPSLGRTDLLGWLTELGEIVYLPDHQFTKGYNMNSEMEEMHRARYGTRVWSFQAL